MAYKSANSESDILDFISQILIKSAGTIVVQAGHFALIPTKDNSKAVPAIIDDIDDDQLKHIIANNPYMGEFPKRTWDTALKIININPKKNMLLSIIVNDWQWLKKSENSKENLFRSDFYKSNTDLPKSFLTSMQRYGISKDKVLPLVSDKNYSIFFGEQRLRNIANRKYKNIEFGQEAKNCAFSYVPFLEYLEKQRVDLLISFIPKSCRNAIDYGTEIFTEAWVFDTNLKIINIFINGTYKEDFYEDTQISTFNL